MLTQKAKIFSNYFFFAIFVAVFFEK